MKKPTSFYVTAELAYLMEFIIKKEKCTRTGFMNEAIQFFLDGDHKVDERILITKKSDPRYIPRRFLQTIHIEEETHERLEEIARDIQAEIEESGRTDMKCNVSQLMFWSLILYCSDKSKEHSEDIKIEK